MRIALLGLLAIFGSVAFAQADLNREDVFAAIGRRLNMSAGSVRAMMRREGLLTQVEALFPKTLTVDSDELIVGEDANALAKTVLNENDRATGTTLIERVPVEVAPDVDADQILLATMRIQNKSIRVVCAAILPGRSEATGARRNRILNTHNKLTDATPEGGEDDEVMRQVRRMIKEMRTSDYVCHAG